MKTPTINPRMKGILDRKVEYVEKNLCPYWRDKCEHKKKYKIFGLGPWNICPFLETANKINNLYEKKEVKKSFYDKVFDFFKVGKEKTIENNKSNVNLTTKVISSETYIL